MLSSGMGSILGIVPRDVLEHIIGGYLGMDSDRG